MCDWLDAVEPVFHRWDHPEAVGVYMITSSMKVGMQMTSGSGDVMSATGTGAASTVK